MTSPGDIPIPRCSHKSDHGSLFHVAKKKLAGSFHVPAKSFSRTRRWRNISLTTGEAMEYGITEAELMEAAGGDLKAYMLAELNRAVDHAVEDRG